MDPLYLINYDVTVYLKVFEFVEMAFQTEYFTKSFVNGTNSWFYEERKHNFLTYIFSYEILCPNAVTKDFVDAKAAVKRMVRLFKIISFK